MSSLVVTFPEEVVPGRDPAGSGEHVVKQGECISFLAAKSGLKVSTIFDHPLNTDLRTVRDDPNVLLPGDRVAIRQIQFEDGSAPTDQLNPFQLNLDPTFLRIRVLDDDAPMAGRPFTLRVGGVTTTGVVKPDGTIEAQISPTALDGFLTVGAGSEPLQLKLNLGKLDPVENNKGVQQRLNNLGFDCGAVDGIIGPRTRGAIRNFQGKNGLLINGILTDETRARLKSEHGC